MEILFFQFQNQPKDAKMVQDGVLFYRCFDNIKRTDIPTVPDG